MQELECDARGQREPLFVARFLGRRPFTPLFAPTLHRRRRVLMETGSRSCVPSPTTGGVDLISSRCERHRVTSLAFVANGKEEGIV